MTKFFLREIDKLKQRLQDHCARVEETVYDAMRAIWEWDGELAQRVIERDVEIDSTEVEIEEECLKILALHQPVAIDLRYTIACLKINNELERIGDVASNIASRAKHLAKLGRSPIPPELEIMTTKTKTMLHNSLSSLINLDAQLARELLCMDEEVDALNRRMHVLMQEQMRKQPEHVERCVLLLSVSRHLERIADYATNIAEDVIYLTEGEIVRHRCCQ